MAVEEKMEIKNIILIVTDAVRARNLSCYGCARRTSPNIDALAKKGVLFENAYACSNNSDSSLLTIFSGKFPRRHGIVTHGSRIMNKDLEKLPCNIFLPQILKKHGYSTLAISSMMLLSRPITRLHRRGYDFCYGTYGSNQPPIFKILRTGWKLFRQLKSNKFISPMINRSQKIKEIKNKLGIDIDAEAVTNAAINLIEKHQNEKFFLFIHYEDTHGPYRAPESLTSQFYDRTRKNNEDDRILKEAIDQFDNKRKPTLGPVKEWLEAAPNLSYILALYDGAIAFIDHEIGRLMEAVGNYGILDNTLIVLTSDHGESHTEHGIYFDSHGLYDVSIQVPLIFKFSNFYQNKRIRNLVQHVDLTPTIMDILQVKMPKVLDGKSLIPQIENEKEQLHSAVYAEEGCTEWKVAIRTDRHKYIYAPSEAGATCRKCNRVHGGSEELYDLKYDPEETQNIAQKQLEMAAALKKRLLKWTDSFERTYYPIYLE